MTVVSLCVPAVTGTHVTPVIGFLNIDPTAPGVLKPSAAEVAQVFTMPLATLTSPKNRVIEQLPLTYNQSAARAGLIGKDGKSYSMPAFLGGPEKIWGLTAYILDQILTDVIIPTMRQASAGAGSDAVSSASAARQSGS